MILFKNFSKKLPGFSLLEAMAAIALTGYMLTALMNLLFFLMQNSYSKHQGIESLLLLKNFWYETDRSKKMNPDDTKKKFEKKTDIQNMELIIEIKKPDTKNKKLEEIESLEIITVTAINNLGKIAQKEQLLFFGIKEKKVEKEPQKEKSS